MRFSQTLWRVIAIFAAVFFFALALRNEVYEATSPRSLTRGFGPEVWHVAHPLWLSVHVWLRKTYSVVAFAIVGFSADRALGATRRPMARAALLVAAYSLCIEIGQRLFAAPEPLFESAFDVGCGAFGGMLAVVIDRSIRRKSYDAPVLRAHRER